MNHIVWGFAVILIIFVVGAMTRSFRIDDDSEKKIVTLPKAFLIIGLVSTIIFFVAALILIIKAESVSLQIALLLFALLSCSLVVAYFNIRIIYDGKGFTHKNFWGNKRTFLFEEIEFIRIENGSAKLYVRKRSVKIEPYATGRHQFIDAAKKRYRVTHDGKAIPEKKSAQKGLFRGNVNNPGEIVFALLLILVLSFGGLIFILILPIIDLQGLEHKTISIKECKYEDNTLLMYANEDEFPFKLSTGTETITNLDGLLYICDHFGILTMEYKTFKEDDEQWHGIVSIIGDDKKVYLTKEEYVRWFKSQLQTPLILFVVLSILAMTITALTIYVGRHPERFGPKIGRLFFKDGILRNQSNHRRLQKSKGKKS